MSEPKPVESKDEKKPEVLHFKKFMDGKMTPEEAHRAWGIRKACTQCGQPAAIRIKVFMPVDELTKRAPQFVAMVCATNPDGPFLPSVDMNDGSTVRKFAKVSDIGACTLCAKDAEIAASKAPSWAIVEIDRGPGTKLQVQVGAPLIQPAR